MMGQTRTKRGLVPGRGWVHLHGSVYEQITSGLRIHLQGMIKLPDGSFRSLTQWPESTQLHRFIQINGGNRKRGLMAFAASILAMEIVKCK